MPNQFSFDGHGINDKGNEFAPRLATLTKDGHARKVGPLFAASAEMLAALEFVCSRTNAKNQFCGGLEIHKAQAQWAEFIALARQAIIDAKA